MPRAQSQQKSKHVEKTLEPEPTRSKKKSSSSKSGSADKTSGSGTSRSSSGSSRSRSNTKSSNNGGQTHEHRTAKVIELVASSTKGFEDAIQNAVSDACRSIHGVHGCDVRNMSVRVRDGKITEYKVDLKLAFGIEQSPSP